MEQSDGERTLAAVHPEAREVLTLLATGQREALGGDLVGQYLFGSAATGWFEPGTSDVDTVALLRADPTEEHLGRLGRLHADIADALPRWEGRVEVVYISTTALAASLRASRPAARISPGERFHPIEVDPSWVLDWYPLRTVGVALHGPPVDELVPSVSRQAYVEAVRGHLLDPRWLEPRAQAGERSYAILTMCRGLRTCRTGEHVSKREGAAWASAIMPDHATVIAGALAWRVQPTDARDDRLLPEEPTRSLILDVQRRAGGEA